MIILIKLYYHLFFNLNIMNNIMKVIKFTSTQEKNSIEEAIQTKAPSQFLFEWFDKDTNSKRMYLFNINYNSNDKTYQLP